MSRRKPLEKTYFDVNALHYYLTASEISARWRLKKPKDLEDRIHLSTMNYLGIKENNIE
ncbi:MAG: hypothetical protein FGF51_07605 [Candidatus Brockarchaeota archaeon]|nr:hypothetical protein [Candidatus Brockarchaeota archaeon]